METRYAGSPDDVKYYTTEQLRKEFLIQKLFQKDQVCIVMSSVDRMAVGTAVPCEEKLKLKEGNFIGAAYFLESRELGLINIGGKGRIIADGQEYQLDHLDGMYVGRETKEVVFASEDVTDPAKFYFNSAPAHKRFPTVKISLKVREETHTVAVRQENNVLMGSAAQCNQRSIIKYILPGQVESCQLVMGMTVLDKGSNWNTMPCHTHARRMEVYLYFDIEKDSLVMHFMGQPQETRHLVVRNEEAVISPEWSIHAGCGTGNYAFVWGMAGENKDFSDIEQITCSELK